MTYSYTQISQYLSCPRRYRYRYLDGWKEKDTRAAMLFGRAFEQALSAYFRREDSAAVLFGEWALHKNRPLEYSKGTTWDRMLQQGIQLLERFAGMSGVRSGFPEAYDSRHQCPYARFELPLKRRLAENKDLLGFVS